METVFLIGVIKDMNIMSFINGRKHRDAEIYTKVAGEMRDARFIRTPDQIKHRWKTLKKDYYRTEPAARIRLPFPSSV